jgi:hypothetical protein
MNLRRKIAERIGAQFGPGWFWSGLRTWAWVAVITVLVWMYADIQFTEIRELRGALRITAPSKDLVLLSAKDLAVTFRVKGNRQEIDQFADRLAGAGGVLTFDASALEPGQLHAERLTDVLTQTKEFREQAGGLTILQATPRDVEVLLDVLRPKPATLELDTGGANVEDVKFEPDNQLIVKAPSTQLDKLPDPLVLRTAPLGDLRDLPPGKTETRQLRIVLPQRLDFLVLPKQTVQVSFKTVQQAEKRKFKLVVNVQPPRPWLDDGTWAKFTIQTNPPDDWTREITLVGSRDDLDKLATRAGELSAFIVPTEGDKAGSGAAAGWIPGQIHVWIPTDLKLRPDDEKIKPIEYRLVKKPE